MYPHILSVHKKIRNVKSNNWVTRGLQGSSPLYLFLKTANAYQESSFVIAEDVDGEAKYTGL